MKTRKCTRCGERRPCAMARRYGAFCEECLYEMDDPRLREAIAADRFWASTWSGSTPRQTKLAVFHHAMNTTPRPTNPSECIGYAYEVHPEELDESDPRLLIETIEAIDPDFFDDYPRPDATKPMDMGDKRAVVEEAAVYFYRHGIPWKQNVLPGI